MASPLEGSMAKTIYKAFKGTLAYDVTLTPVTIANRAETEGAAITFKGLEISAEEAYRQQGVRVEVGMIEDDMVGCILLQQSQPGVVPKNNDKITLRSQTFRIVKIGRDPAEAIWIIIGRVT